MAECTVCGNDYDKAFRVTTADGRELVFDSLECAIHAMAPSCDRCGCRIIGHGHESDGATFCCAHCAQMGADLDVRDRDDRTTT